MYYIVKRKYVGPNPDHDDLDTIEIRTSPALKNLSHEVCTEGWCGTTSDWSVYAHGQYPTIEQARAAIIEQFGEVRDSDRDGNPFDAYDDNVVATYKPGRYEPMGRDFTAEWADESIQADIDADTTDARIAELVSQYEAEANSEGYTLDDSLAALMKAQRQQLCDALEENEA